MTQLIVRAVDVGYGHIKFSTGLHHEAVLTRDIPSQATVVNNTKGRLTDSILKGRDTFLVPIWDRYYEVGKDVLLALSSNQITEVLDNEFALSDHYAARLYGAINYMLPLPDNKIDVLVLGLPLNTFARLKEPLASKFNGEFVVNHKGNKVAINSCHVYPQPLGSYMAYLSTGADDKNPQALCIDPGYNTVDWFVCKGMTAIPTLSGAVKRGMGAVIKAMAAEMIHRYKFDEDDHELIRLIDQAIITKQKLKVYGREFDLESFHKAGEAIIEQAAQAVRDSVGDGKAISVIILTGGGASFYESAIRKKFPRHTVHVLQRPAHANVRGFHLIGEMIATKMQQESRGGGSQ